MARFYSLKMTGLEIRLRFKPCPKLNKINSEINLQLGALQWTTLAGYIPTNRIVATHYRLRDVPQNVGEKLSRKRSSSFAGKVNEKFEKRDAPPRDS